MQSSANQKIKKQIQINEPSQEEWDIIPDYYGESGSLNLLRVFEKNETNKKKKTALIYCAIIVIASAFMFAVVHIHVSISEQHIKNQKIEETISSAEEELNVLEVKQNSLRDLNKIMKRAEELGMDFAESENIEYIDIDFTDNK